MLKSYHIVKGDINPSSSYHLLQFDGLSVPNPGEATSGAVLYSPTKERIAEKGIYLAHGTNNQAEYRGLLLGLELCIRHGIQEILIEGDSQLVVMQVANKWKVKNVELQQIHHEIQELIRIHLRFVGIRHIPREQNQYADGITNHVFKTKQAYEWPDVQVNVVPVIDSIPSEEKQIKERIEHNCPLMKKSDTDENIIQSLYLEVQTLKQTIVSFNTDMKEMLRLIHLMYEFESQE